MKNLSTMLKGSLAAGLLIAGGGIASAFPTLQELSGSYLFSSNMETVTELAGLQDEFFFEINYLGYGTDFEITGFPYSGMDAIPATYNASTGVLTFSKGYFGNSILGYKLFSSSEDKKANALTISFNADGSEATIPNFSYGFGTGLTLTTVYAEYSNITVTPGMESADESPLNGTWTWTLEENYNIQGDLGNPGTYSATYEAFVKDGIVTFTRVGTAPAGQLDWPIIATVGENNTLTFEKTPVFLATYPVFQVPFTNGGTSISALNTTPFTATYDEATGSLIFPDAADGLRYKNFQADGSDDPSIDFEWQYAVNFVSAVQGDNADPSISLGLVQPFEIGNDYIIVTYAATVTGLSQIASFGATVTEKGRDDSGDETDNPVDPSDYEVSYANGYISIKLMNLDPGIHSWNVTFLAYNSDGQVVASSVMKAISLTVATEIAVWRPKVTVSGYDATVTLETRVWQLVPDDATFKMRFLVDGSITDDNEEGETFEQDATYDPTTNTVSSVFTNLDPGNYNYTAYVVVYEDGEEYYVSNGLGIGFTIDDLTLPQVEISSVSYNFADGGLVVSFNAELSGNTDDIDSYVVRFEDLNNPGTYEFIDADYSNGVVTAIYPGLEAGDYSFQVVLYLYDANDDYLAMSNSLGFRTGTSGIDGIGVDNGEVRYFNLNGVEVTNPTKGGIYIKVQNGKAVKSVVR